MKPKAPKKDKKPPESSGSKTQKEEPDMSFILNLLPFERVQKIIEDEINKLIDEDFD